MSTNTNEKHKRNRGPMGGGPMGGGMMPVEKAKDFKGSLKKLAAYLSPYKIKIFIVVFFSLISTVFAIVGPKIMAKATDKLVEGIMNTISGGTVGVDFTYIAKVLIFLVVLYLISSIFSFIQGYIMSGVSTKVTYDLRNEIMKKINRMPLSYFNRTSHGDVLSRITNDIDTINQSLSQSISQLISSFATILGVIIMMFSISWKLTLVAICMLPLTTVLVMIVVKASQKYFKGQQQFLGSLNGHIKEMYGGHIVVKAFNREDESIKKFDEQNDKLFEANWKAQFLSGMMHPIMNFVGNLGYVVICVIGAALAASGSMTIGGIQAFIQYVRSFTQPIVQLANISNQIQQTIASSERVFEFLEEGEETVVEPKMRMADMEVKGNIRFEHVRFGYEDSDQIVIKDFSANVLSGQKVAIVGPTGAGKTTMVKLLMRFHDLKSGAIYLDETDITDFSRQDLRTEFGMVLQDTWLYNASIMDNIRYGRLDATDEEVIRAAKAAQVDHFVRTLPDSYNMILNEDATNISQGQKQLMTIARAILSDMKILILDEATSSVDTRTEILIQKAMDNLTEGRTSFIIAHRLSTIRNADLILYMNDGDIVEQGTHDELMARGGSYANLYNSQFEKAS